MLTENKMHLNSFHYVMLLLVILVLAYSVEPVLAISPGWSLAAFNINSGGVSGVGSAHVLLTDTTAVSGQGTITARITSDSDPVGFDLTLNEGPLGTYTNTQLALMDAANIFSATDSVRITIEDTAAGGAPILPGTPGAVLVFTDSELMSPLVPEFTLSSKPDIYEATIMFGPITNHTANIIAASPGDIFSISDLVAGTIANGFFGPNPNVGKGAILVAVNGTVTAEISGDALTSQFIVTSPPGGGRGGGGVIPQVVVVDSPRPSESGGSNCSGDCTPPTLGLDHVYSQIVTEGFSYNDNPVDVELFYTPYPLITANVGNESIAKLKIYENNGPQNIEHVGLAFGLGKDESFNDSKATINLDRARDGSESVFIYDPENVLDNVQVFTATGPCNDGISTPQCLIVSIYHTFRESLNFNMVGTLVWDFDRNSWQNYYNHGIHVEGESLNPAKTVEIAFGEKDMRGIFILMQVDKKKDLWADEFGHIYLNKGNDRFDRIFSPQKKINYDDLKMNGCNRTCNWFDSIKMHQTMLAEITLDELLDGKQIYSFPDESFSHEFNSLERHEDSELQSAIENEIKKANTLYLLLYGDAEY